MFFFFFFLNLQKEKWLTFAFDIFNDHFNESCRQALSCGSVLFPLHEVVLAFQSVFDEVFLSIKPKGPTY